MSAETIEKNDAKLDTKSLALELIQMLRENRNVEANERFHAENVHVEEADSNRTRSGKAVVLKTMRDFAESHRFNYTAIEGPLVSNDSFAIRMIFDAENIATGQTFTVDEIGVYQVENGKIVREQFFYPANQNS